MLLTTTGNKRMVEARLTQKAKDLGLKSRDLGKKAKGLPTGSPKRAKIEREIDDIFNWLKTAPTAEVVTVKSN